MQIPSRLRAERTLAKQDLGRLAEVREGQVGQRLDVVGSGILPREREREPLRRGDLSERAAHDEWIALGRLHLDAVVRADPRLEVEAAYGEPQRAPPLR